MNQKPFDATEEVVRNASVITILGELDIATSPKVRELLSEAARDGDRPLVIDLTGCEFVDSTGLATLLHGAKPAQNGESNVALVLHRRRGQEAPRADGHRPDDSRLRDA